MTNTKKVEKLVNIIVGIPTMEIENYHQLDSEGNVSIQVGDLIEFSKEATITTSNSGVQQVLKNGLLVGNVLTENIISDVLKSVNNTVALDDKDVIGVETVKSLLDKDAISQPKVSHVFADLYRKNVIVITQAIALFDEEQLFELTVENLENEFPSLTKEEIEERFNYLTDLEINPKIILNVFKKIKPREDYEEMSKFIIEKPKTLYHDELNFVRDALALSLMGSNLMFKGPKAVGKNVLADTIAWLYRKPIAIVSMHRDMTDDKLVGDKTFVEGEGVKFSLGVVPRMAEVGGVVVLDELNMADPSMSAMLHTLLESKKEMVVPDYGKVVADKDFLVIATQNPGYVGTNSDNDATASRFENFMFPSSVDIRPFLKSETGCKSEILLNKTQNIYQRVQQMVIEGVVDEKALNVRSLIRNLSAHLEYDIPYAQILKRGIMDSVEDEDERKALEDVIFAVVGEN